MPAPTLAQATRDSARIYGPLSMGALTADMLEDLEYRLIGPANTSGRVTTLVAPAGSRGQTMYVGFAGGGVWKTANHGTTWESVWDDHMSSIGDIAIAPSDARILWVGTGERQSLRSNAWGDGVYKSTNGGRTWTYMGLEDTRSIGRIAIHPEDPDIVYVAAMGHIWGTNDERGVYKTTDGGATWRRVLFVNDTTAFVDLKMDPTDPDVLYASGWHRIRRGGPVMEGAGVGSGIWKTTDGGATWDELTDPSKQNGLPNDRLLGRIGLAISPQNNRRIYANIQTGEGAWNQTVSTHGGLFRSDDAGRTWTRLHDFSALPDYFYNEVWLDPNDEDNIYLPSVQVARSRDGGRTFESWRMQNVHVDHHAFWIDPNDSQHMVLGNDGGVYISWDGGSTWDHQNIPAEQFYEVMIDSTKQPYEVCGGKQDNGIWCGPHRTRERTGITNRDWYSVYGGDGFYSAVAPDSSNFRYGESQYAGISMWDTRTMERIGLQPYNEDAGAGGGFAFRWDWNTPFVLSHHDPTIVYLGGNHLFRLPNRGRSGWELMSPDLTRGNRAHPAPDTGYTAYRALHSIAESPLDPDVIWTGSDDGLIHVTFDRGASWQNVTANIPDSLPRYCWVAEIEASRHDPRTAFVVQDCHRRDDYRPWVHVTRDGGATFTSITGNLPADGGSYVIRQDATNPDLLFVGTERGLYFSNRGGRDWLRLRNNLPTAPIRDMDIAYSENDLVIGTFGRSAYILDITPLQELTDSVLAADAHLFAIEDVRRFGTVSTYESHGSSFFRTPNPPSGARIAYWLKADAGADVELQIRRVASPLGDAREPSERAIREDADAPDRAPVVATVRSSGRPGLHVAEWDLQAERPRARALGDPESPDALRRVEPGTYSVSLTVNGVARSRTFTIIEGWYD
jgi:photosystem II stability/assembly factor-like uncharacterized protein